MAGCGGTTNCGGVCWDGVLVTLAKPMGGCCPQGSELPGDVSALCCLSVWCVSTASGGVADAIGWNVEEGFDTKPEVEGKGVLGGGYIPGCLSCRSMRSALPVTLSMVVVVSYSSGKSLMS